MKLEEQLSLFDLVLNASLTVQFVMLLLLLASVVSWYMIAHRLIYFQCIEKCLDLKLNFGQA